MAFFGVTIEEIGSIEPIVGADRIVKASLKNVAFSFVVGKGLFEVGQKCLYFPIDSIIPVPVQEKLGVVGKLAGNAKDRIKTVKLKGVLSQGIVGPVSLISDIRLADSDLTSEVITNWLGVTKYEPPVIPDKAGNLKQLPCGLSVYDIEGCERFYVPLERLMDQKVWVLEKVEGSNGSVSFAPATGETFVNQRRHTIEEVEGHEHAWWAIARRQGFVDFVKTVAGVYNEVATLYFEVAGPAIQGNIYKLKEPTGFIFDLKIGEKFVSKGVMFSLLDQHFGAGKYSHAPVLSQGKTLREWLGDKTIVQASNGESKLYKTLREGIVISPEVEQEDETLGGRLILKQRDSVYLSQTDN
jgi:RNA ligase (TIGR02306 family)